MNTRLAVLALAFTALGWTVGCGEPPDEGSDVVAAWQVHPDPPDTGPATISFALADSAGTPLQGADVKIEGVMTHPGMAPVLAHAHEVAPGRYKAELDFSMRGDWVLILDATLADGRSIQARKDVPGVGGRSR